VATLEHSCDFYEGHQMQDIDQPKFSVIIPISNLQNDPYRLRSFEYVLNRLVTKMMPSEIIIVEQVAPGNSTMTINIKGPIVHLAVEMDDPFHRGLLCNIGCEKSSNELLLITDADVALNWTKVRTELMHFQHGSFCMPYTYCLRINEKGTENIYNGKAISTTHVEGKAANFGGGAFLIYKDDFLAIGEFDERYSHGWGVEDEALGRMAKQLLHTYKLNCDAYHLYHPRNQETLMHSESQRIHRGIFNSTLYPDIPVSGLAVVAASWGSDTAHIEASKLTFEEWFKQSAQPEVYVIVEAVKVGEPYHFAFDRPNVVHIPLVLTDKNNGFFHKEGMWNEAYKYLRIHYPKLIKTAFLDSHLIPPENDKLYFAKISVALNKYEVVQPFVKCGDTHAKDCPRIGLIYGYLHNASTAGTPGFAYTTRNDVHDRIGDFPIIPTCAGDTTAYMRLIPNGFSSRILAMSALKRIIKYESPGIKPTIGYVDCNVLHATHGSFSNRCYSEQTLLLNYACSHPNEICKVEGGLTTFTESAYSHAFADVRMKLRPNMTACQIRNLWDDAVRTYMPPITKADDLVVVCVLRSGGEYTPDHVRWFVDQIEDKLKTPHRVLCLSDVEVDDVPTIFLKHNLPTTRSKLEVFRPDLFENSNPSVLLMDLDTVIYSEFTMPVCPLNDVYYVRENERRASWPAWNSSVLYFRPSSDLTTVLTRFLTDRDEGRSPDWMFPGEQEWSSYVIYHFLKSYQLKDIERLVPVRFWNRDTVPPEESTIVTWATPSGKPWNANLSWIPPLLKRV